MDKSGYLRKIVNYTMFVLCGIVFFCLETDSGNKYNYFSTLVNQPYMDFSDLDVRDISNKTITTDRAKENLRDLFLNSLYTLLVKTEIHSILNILKLIDKKVNPSALNLTKEAVVILNQFIQAILLFIKRLGLVFILLGLVCLDINLKIYPTFFSYLFYSPKSKVAPLVLRC